VIASPSVGSVVAVDPPRCFQSATRRPRWASGAASTVLVRCLTFPVRLIMARRGPFLALGSFLLLSCDASGGAAQFSGQRLEVAIGMTIPISAIAILRQRSSPAAFERGSSLAGDVRRRRRPLTAGWLDEIVEVRSVLAAGRRSWRARRRRLCTRRRKPEQPN